LQSGFDLATPQPLISTPLALSALWWPKGKTEKNRRLTCQLMISAGSLMRLTVDGARSFQKNQFLRFFFNFWCF